MIDIPELEGEAIDAIRPLLEKMYRLGYEAGLAHGQEQAKDQLLTFLAEMNTDNIRARPMPIARHVVYGGSPPDSPPDEDRMPPGSVKPVVLKVINDNPGGVTTRDIERLTGFKHNSVRGTVWLLNKEGFIRKAYGNRWVPADVSKGAAEQEVLDTVLKHEDGSQGRANASVMFD